MLSRRNFLKLSALIFGNALAAACTRAIETVASATITLTPTLTLTSTPTTTTTSTTLPTPTSTPTVTPSRTPTITATPRSADFVSVRGDQFFYRGARFPINGFNYYPRAHPWRTFNLGEWEPDVTEKELKLGVSLGANTVRIFIDFNASLTGTLTASLPDSIGVIPNRQYLAHVSEFIDLAGRLNLKVQFTLFDGMDWSFYQPEKFWLIETYLYVLISPFVNDPRIMCWDLQNEPDRAIRTVGADIVIPFFQRVSKTIRQLDPRQLQTIGWIGRDRSRYFPDLDKYLDYWCFHFYDKATNLPDLVKFYKTQTTKPVLLQEFGLPTGGPGPDGQNTETDQANHYDSVLKTLDENQMCGSVFWCLNDFPVGLAGNPPIQTDHPENHFGVLRLDYSEKPVTQILRKYWRR